MNKFIYLMLFILPLSYTSISFSYHKCNKKTDTPIKIKKHGRHAMSLFRSGANILRRILCKTPSKAEVRQILRILFSPPDGIQRLRIGVTL